MQPEAVLHRQLLRNSLLGLSADCSGTHSTRRDGYQPRGTPGYVPEVRVRAFSAALGERCSQAPGQPAGGRACPHKLVNSELYSKPYRANGSMAPSVPCRARELNEVAVHACPSGEGACGPLSAEVPKQCAKHTTAKLRVDYTRIIREVCGAAAP